MSKKLAHTTLIPSILFVEGSHAKTSAAPGKEQGLKVSDRDSGFNLKGLQMSSIPVGSLSKTSNTHGGGGCPSCGADCTLSGMPACRFDCPPLTWVHGIEGDEFSYLPTPTASSYGSCRGGGQGRTGKWRKSLSGLFGGPHAPSHREWMMGFPIGWTEIDASETQ